MSAEQAARRAEELQRWICDRPLDLPPTPDKLMMQLRGHLLRAKAQDLLTNSRDQLSGALLKKTDPVAPQLYKKLTLEPEHHPPRQVFSIVGGEKDFDRRKNDRSFQRDDGAWFNFTMTLFRSAGKNLTLLAYDFEICWRVGDTVSFVRYDLNPPANRRSDGMRCHLHPNKDDDGLSVPAPLMTPEEILDLFIYGLRLRRKARHARGRDLSVPPEIPS